MALSGYALSARSLLDQVHLDQMLGKEPHLELVPAQDVAHQQVIRAPILGFLGRLDVLAHLADDRLVRLQQAGDLRGHVLRPVRRALDRGQLGRVSGIADRDAAERLDALGKEVDQLELLLGVLVEQEVELVEGWPGHVPVRLLVEGIQDGGVRQDLVQEVAALWRTLSSRPIGNARIAVNF